MTNTFTVGQPVKIVTHPAVHPSFNDNPNVGQIGTVLDVYTDSCRVRVGSGSDWSMFWNLQLESLELKLYTFIYGSGMDDSFEMYQVIAESEDEARSLVNREDPRAPLSRYTCSEHPLTKGVIRDY